LAFLQDLDRDFLLALNGSHTSTLDPIFWFISQPKTWILVYLVLLVTVIWRYRSSQWIWVLASFGLMLFLCDFVVTHGIKNTIQRLRPSHEPGLQALLHLLPEANGNLYKGGKFGFFSSHASNHAGLVTLYLLWMRPLAKHWCILLIVWALLVSYSRIYLGVHYPSDILSGLLYGTIVAVLLHLLFRRFIHPSTIT
jgi:undecaprenyl-diphosphatase